MLLPATVTVRRDVNSMVLALKIDVNNRGYSLSFKLRLRIWLQSRNLHEHSIRKLLPKSLENVRSNYY